MATRFLLRVPMALVLALVLAWSTGCDNDSDTSLESLAQQGVISDDPPQVELMPMQRPQPGGPLDPDGEAEAVSQGAIARIDKNKGVLPAKPQAEPMSAANEGEGATTSARDGAELSRHHFVVAGLHCGGCAGGVEHALSQVEGVEKATVSYRAEGGPAEVVYDPAVIDPQAIERAATMGGKYRVRAAE